jgi:hypothetical protein
MGELIACPLLRLQFEPGNALAIGESNEQDEESRRLPVNSMKNALSDAIEHPVSEPRTRPNTQHREGEVARGIEQQTAKIPSDTFLWSALGSMGMALTLRLLGKKDAANFVGQWAPSFLILGMYNKMVKLHGSDGA